MDFSTFAAIVEKIEAGQPADLPLEDAYALLNEARARRIPLSPAVIGKVNATLAKTSPVGWLRSVETNLDGVRIVVRKRGRLLPADSGDTTP